MKTTTALVKAPRPKYTVLRKRYLGVRVLGHNFLASSNWLCEHCGCTWPSTPDAVTDCKDAP